jgi:DNA-binding LacI/PurR family transcriptional regulator
VTLNTIADAVGVSRTTVSNAYNRPDQLAPELRDRILGTARRLGYSGPDPAARRLRSGRRDAVGLLLSGGLSHAFTDPAAAVLLSGIAQATESAGLAMLVVPERGNGVRDAVVDAFCLYALAEDHPSVAAARVRGLPLVVIDAPRLQGHAFVASEDRLGARLAAEHLLGLGHRRFALLTDGRHGERLAGYRDALAPGGAEWVEAPRFEPGPTAVLAVTDQLALGVLEAAEVSVVGFGDIPAAAPAGLTTVRQPLFEKGEIAGRLLSEGGADEVILPVELVVRGSTSGAPA